MAKRPDPERLEVWRQLRHAHTAIVRQLEADLDEQRGLPLDWYDVLAALAEARGRLRMRELADRLLVHKSSLSRVCDRMEAEGLLVREPDPDDGRGVYAVLTPEGRETYKRATPVHLRGVHDQFTGYLTDSDVVALQRVFAKLPSRGE